MEPIRILHMIRDLTQGRGVTESVMVLYRNIDRTKVQFDFISHNRNEDKIISKEIQSMGGFVYSIPEKVQKNRYLYKRYWGIFFQQHPEYRIIHAHTNGSIHDTAPIFLPIAKDHGLKTIVHSRNTGIGFGINQRYSMKVRYFLKKCLLRLLRFNIHDDLDYYFACSMAAGESVFGKKIINRLNFKVIFSARNLEDYTFNVETRKKIRRELGIDDNTFVIGHVGRFEKQKNHSFLINIFKKIYTIEKNIVLILVGNNNTLIGDLIIEKVKNLKLINNVIFTGVRSDVNNLMQGMDIFVLPSLFEGLPGTAIEAQAAGLKCFLSDTITQETKVTDLVTFLTIRGSTDIWAENIISCIRDQYKRKDMVEQVRETGFDVVKTANWLEDFYYSILNE